MSVEAAKTFLQRLEDDEEFRRRVYETAEAERGDIARDEGYRFTEDEFDVALAEVAEVVGFAQALYGVWTPADWPSEQA